jgi:hypothetical protein
MCGSDISDQRNAIIAQYIKYQVALTPSCGDFTQNPQPSPNFSFGMLKSPTADWAILRSVLLTGLENILKSYGMALTINTVGFPHRGYRTPQDQYDVDTSASPPRQYNVKGPHQFGIAADIDSNAGTWDDIKAAAKKAGACVEPIQSSLAGHVHVDWRSARCPTNW